MVTYQLKDFQQFQLEFLLKKKENKVDFYFSQNSRVEFESKTNLTKYHLRRQRQQQHFSKRQYNFLQKVQMRRLQLTTTAVPRIIPTTQLYRRIVVLC